MSEANEALRIAREVADYSWGIHLAGTPNEAVAIALVERLRAALKEQPPMTRPVFIVYTTGWDPEVDSVWDNIESAKARADEINPARDWGIIERRDMNSTEQEQVDRQEQPR